MPEVSVIIPNYNHSEYLNQRIESVLNQTFQDFEIILLDDCSADNSRDILRQYGSHKKVSHLLFNESNSGSPFKQWEKGIELAKGKYIWIAESDDWCEPSLLQHLVEGINKDPECVISYCQSHAITNSNELDWSSSHPQLSEMVDGSAFARNHMLLTNPIYNASMVLWRREFYPVIPKEFKNYKLAGDWVFWMELSRLGKVHISGRVLNYFRKHDKNVSGKAFKSGLNFVETLKIIKSLYRRQMISEADLYKAFKIQFKNYVQVETTLDPKLREEIKILFKGILTSKATYYKILLSIIWKCFKQKQFSYIASAAKV